MKSTTTTNLQGDELRVVRQRAEGEAAAVGAGGDLAADGGEREPREVRQRPAGSVPARPQILSQAKLFLVRGGTITDHAASQQEDQTERDTKCKKVKITCMAQADAWSVTHILAPSNQRANIDAKFNTQ